MVTNAKPRDRAGFPVLDDDGLADRAGSGEELLEIGLFGIEGEIPNEQFG